MTRQTNRRLVEAFVLAHDPSVLADHVVLHDQAQERSYVGRPAVAALLNAFFVQGFTAVRAEVQSSVVDQHSAALVFTFHGRQDGLFLGIPPTHRLVTVPMVVVCRIEDGQITCAMLFYNAGTLLRQLGLANG